METKAIIIAAVAAGIGMVCLGSCSQNEMAYQGKDKDASKLRVTTRTEGEPTPPKDAVIYLFNNEGKCTNIISSAEVNNSKGTQIEPGDYKLVTIGSNHLSNYTLPDKTSANDSSIIKLNEGITNTDLLQATDNITLNEGETTNANITVKREMICLNKITIDKIPADVKKAELAISPIYKNIRFDGKYTNDVDTIKIELTKGAETGVWTYQGDTIFSLPTKGNPTVKLTATSDDVIIEYTITGNKPYAKNRQVKLDITYNEGMKTYFSSSINATDWEGTDTISYEFSDKDITKVDSIIKPVAGKKYKKYYVVSVDSSNRKAVLLRKKGDTGIASKEQMEKTAADINIIDGAVSEWRLPHEEEIRYVLENCTLAKGDTVYTDQVVPGTYYCQIDGKVCAATLEVDKSNERKISIKNDSGYKADYIYRPVIEIKY